MQGKLLVATSVFAGASCCVRTWLDWSGHQPVGVGDHVRLLASYAFWEVALDSYLHKLLILNAGCCLLYVLGKLLQELLLGPLREMEAMKVGDRIRSYALVKMVFIGAILHDHDEKEMMIWFVWLALVGFVKQLGLLVRDRLEFVTLAIHTKSTDLLGLGALLSIVLMLNTFLVFVCLRVFGCWIDCEATHVGVLLLLLFECMLTYIDSFQTTLRVAFHMINLARDGHWEQRSLYAFYCELSCQLVVHTLSLFHFIHIWAVHGLSVSLTDFLLFLHTRAVINKIRAKLASLTVFLTIDKRLPDASPEQLEALQDSCAICREDMTAAKVLPCGHLFHLVCLRDWLDQSPSCPICRRPVFRSGAENGGEGGGAPNDGNIAPAMGAGSAAAGAGGREANAEPGWGAGRGEGGGRLDASVEANGNAQVNQGERVGEPEARARTWPWRVLDVIGRGLGLHLVGLGWQGGFDAEGGGVDGFDDSVAGDVSEEEDYSDAYAHAPAAVSQAMIRQVLDFLPSLSPDAVRRDLMLTGAVDVTIHRGLEGLIPDAPNSEPSPPSDPPTQAVSQTAATTACPSEAPAPPLPQALRQQQRGRSEGPADFLIDESAGAASSPAAGGRLGAPFWSSDGDGEDGSEDEVDAFRQGGALAAGGCTVKQFQEIPCAPEKRISVSLEAGDAENSCASSSRRSLLAQAALRRLEGVGAQPGAPALEGGAGSSTGTRSL